MYFSLTWVKILSIQKYLAKIIEFNQIELVNMCISYENPNEHIIFFILTIIIFFIKFQSVDEIFIISHEKSQHKQTRFIEIQNFRNLEKTSKTKITFSQQSQTIQTPTSRTRKNKHNTHRPTHKILPDPYKKQTQYPSRLSPATYPITWKKIKKKKNTWTQTRSDMRTNIQHHVLRRSTNWRVLFTAREAASSIGHLSSCLVSCCFRRLGSLAWRGPGLRLFERPSSQRGRRVRVVLPFWIWRFFSLVRVGRENLAIGSIVGWWRLCRLIPVVQCWKKFS